MPLNKDLLVRRDADGTCFPWNPYLTGKKGFTLCGADGQPLTDAELAKRKLKPGHLLGAAPEGSVSMDAPPLTIAQERLEPMDAGHDEAVAVPYLASTAAPDAPMETITLREYVPEPEEADAPLPENAAPSEEMSAKQLRAYGAEHYGVTLSPKLTKAQMVEQLGQLARRKR